MWLCTDSLYGDTFDRRGNYMEERKISFRSLTKEERKRFCQSKYDYYRSFNTGLMIVSVVSYLTFFLRIVVYLADLLMKPCCRAVSLLFRLPCFFLWSLISRIIGLWFRRIIC